MNAIALGLTVARGLHVAATLAVFGTLILALLGISADSAAELRWRSIGFDTLIRRIVMSGIAAAVIGALLWLPFQAAAMSGSAGVPEALGAVPAVLQTRFGHFLIGRIGLLMALVLLLRMNQTKAVRLAAVVIAGLATALQAGMGHAAAAESAFVAAAEVAHVLAAGAWLGGLLPLWVLIRQVPGPSAESIVRRFSAIAATCVAVLALSAVVQVREWIGGLASLVGTDYGVVALAKLGLFVLLLGLAAINRFVLLPVLAADGTARTANRLGLSIAFELVLGLATTIAASRMATLSPAMHGQPWWPFAVQPSLTALTDPDLQQEVLVGVFAINFAAVLFAIGLIAREVRWACLLAVVAMGAFASSRLDLLFVQAYPTSFYRSPTGFTAASIANGARLFQDNCAGCHGAGGRGDGPLAAGLPVPPADLTAAHLWDHSDGELFWWLTHGIDATDGSLSMPGFADRLTEVDRWNLIDYVHANASGAEVAENGHWSRATTAPVFDVTCGNGDVFQSSVLHGQPIRIVASESAETFVSPELSGVMSILIAPGESSPANGLCVAGGADAWSALSVVSGTAPEALDGAQFIVDGDGSLRLRLRPGQSPELADAGRLAAAINGLRARPVSAAAPLHHH